MKSKSEYDTKVKQGKAVRTKASDQARIDVLVEKAASGDIEAFGELYSVYLDPIYRYVLYQVKDKMTAEDITEEVFMKAWKAIGSCKGKGKTFSSWLYRIAHNHLLNTLKSMQKLISIEDGNLPEPSNHEPGFELRMEQKELREMIYGLPPNQKQVILLKFIEGYDNREIGRIIGKSEGAVRVLQMRALSSLRQKLSRD